MWYIVVACLLLICIIWLIRGNNTVRLTRYEIESDKIETDLNVIHISDFHSCKRLKSRTEKIIEKENPDIVVITGDLICGEEDDFDIQEDMLQNISAPKYFVCGNHEKAIKEHKKFFDMLKKAGVKVVYEWNNIPVRGDIRLCGVKDPQKPGLDYEGEKNSLKARTDRIKVDTGKYNILLTHRPDVAGYQSKKGFDLILAGHTHGGQIRVPLIGGMFAPGQGWIPDYSGGRYRENDADIIVNRGIGDSRFPIRINNTPEIVKIRLKRKN